MATTSSPREAGTGRAWAKQAAPAGAAGGISALEAGEGSDLVRDLLQKGESLTQTLLLQRGALGKANAEIWTLLSAPALTGVLRQALGDPKRARQVAPPPLAKQDPPEAHFPRRSGPPHLNIMLP